MIFLSHTLSLASQTGQKEREEIYIKNPPPSPTFGSRHLYSCSHFLNLLHLNDCSSLSLSLLPLHYLSAMQCRRFCVWMGECNDVTKKKKSNLCDFKAETCVMSQSLSICPCLEEWLAHMLYREWCYSWLHAFKSLRFCHSHTWNLFFCIFTTYIKQWHGEVNEVWSKLSFNVVQSQFEIAILFLNASFHLKYFFSTSFVPLIFLELNCSMNLNFIIVFNILNFIPVRKAAQTFFSRKKTDVFKLKFWLDRFNNSGSDHSNKHSLSQTLDQCCFVKVNKLSRPKNFTSLKSFQYNVTPSPLPPTGHTWKQVSLVNLVIRSHNNNNNVTQYTASHLSISLHSQALFCLLSFFFPLKTVLFSFVSVL